MPQCNYRVHTASIGTHYFVVLPILKIFLRINQMLKLTNYDLNKNLMSCKEIKLYYSRKDVLKKYVRVS